MQYRLAIIGGLLVAALGVPAARAASYLATEGHWTIAALSATRCFAINRPLEEINGSPYNALWLSQKTGGGVELQVLYWPGALPTGVDVKLTLRFENGKRQTYPATAADSYLAVATSPLTDDDIAALGASALTTVSASGLPNGQLFFVTTAVPAVAAKLGECVASLTPQ
jgi:hypothetical protein